MKAIVIKGVNKIEVENITTPNACAPEHLLIKMQACAINSGDKLFISGAFPRGIPLSQYNIAGVSGVGKVIDAGKDVPAYYKDKNVAIYRSLKPSAETIGTWSEYAHLHYLNCAVIPQPANPEQYTGSLVNIITAYSFLQQAQQEGHKAIICTAGNSATGKAMLGLCLVNHVPVISIVRSEEGKQALEQMGAKNILVQNDSRYKQQLQQTAEQLGATVVFDGVGGETLSNIIDILPFNSSIYSYGFLDKETPFSFHTTTLMRGITIKGFSNYRTATVQDPIMLERALQYISSQIANPLFQTAVGKQFKPDAAQDALAYTKKNGKAILMFNT